MLFIRLSQNTFAFLRPGGDPDTPRHAIYDTKGGISISANLREAFQHVPLLQSSYDQAIILVDTPILPVPEEEFHEDDVDILFNHAFSGHDQDIKKHVRIDSLHAEVIFSIEKDILTVMGDHFPKFHFLPVCHPVWLHASQQPDTVGRLRLHAYFHDGKVDVFCLNKHRFKFCNTFGATHQHDVLYYLLNAFTLLGMHSDRDEVVVMGSTPHKKWIVDNLGHYVSHAFAPDLSAATPESQQTLPYDLTLLSTQSLLP